MEFLLFLLQQKSDIRVGGCGFTKKGTLGFFRLKSVSLIDRWWRFLFCSVLGDEEERQSKAWSTITSPSTTIHHLPPISSIHQTNDIRKLWYSQQLDRKTNGLIKRKGSSEEFGAEGSLYSTQHIRSFFRVSASFTGWSTSTSFRLSTKGDFFLSLLYLRLVMAFFLFSFLSISFSVCVCVHGLLYVFFLSWVVFVICLFFFS